MKSMARPKGSKDKTKRRSKNAPLPMRDSVTGRLKSALKIETPNFETLSEDNKKTFESPISSSDEWKPFQEPPPKIEKVEVVEDTTEESRAFIKGAFEIPAGILNDRRIALMSDEVEAIAPSWKPIYDKYIKPAFGEKAELYIFAFCMAGIVGKRIPYFQEDIRKIKNGSKPSQQYPSYSSEERNGQVHTDEAPAPRGQGVSESNL